MVPGVLAPGGFPLVSSTDGVVQAGVFGSDWDYRSFPSIAANHCDDMMVGYSYSKAPAASTGSWYPSIYVAGRQHDEPPGVIGGERLMKKGAAAYSSFQDNGGAAPVRWGDYSGMSVDPDDDPKGTRGLSATAVETDHEYFQLFGDATEATAYLVALYAEVSAGYLRDVDTCNDPLTTPQRGSIMSYCSTPARTATATAPTTSPPSTAPTAYGSPAGRPRPGSAASTPRPASSRG